MKRYLLIAVIVAFSAFNLVSAYTQSASANEADLSCASAGCPKGPGCGTSGIESLCNLSCSDGVLVICPKPGDND